MNPYRMTAPPRWWGPKLSPQLVRLLRPVRRQRRRREQRVMDVTVQGVEHVRAALSNNRGILITPNHSTHADPYTMYEAADQVGRAFFFLSTWHVFDRQGRIGQWILQKHGVFSIDREGADLQAFKQAVKIVQEEPHPLVIFPEGEVYHCNDRVTPFREGASAIALAAAKRANRPIACIPCALKYEYVEDPTEDLKRLMDELERRIHWRPRRHDSLVNRIYAFAEAMMALKEMEFLGQAQAGTLTERTDVLADHILCRLEERYQVATNEAAIPERVKELRRRALSRLSEITVEETERPAERDVRQINDDLDDLFLVVQLFSYPGDYVVEQPSVERLAETLDKFEEDVLHLDSATIRAKRRVTVQFDEPVPVAADRKDKLAARTLTETLEKRVQGMLDSFGDSNAKHGSIISESC